MNSKYLTGFISVPAVYYVDKVHWYHGEIVLMMSMSLFLNIGLYGNVQYSNVCRQLIHEKVKVVENRI